MGGGGGDGERGKEPNACSVYHNISFMLSANSCDQNIAPSCRVLNRLR